MNKLTKIALAASLLVGGIASTQACGLGAWDDNATSTSLAGGPAEAGALQFARYQGLCAMKTDGATPSVKNNGVAGATSGPSAEASMIARFYFLPGAATGDIYTTYAEDAATNAVYTVSYAGGNVTVTPNGGGPAAVVPVGATNWHSVEVKWTNNGGAIDVWVDTDATTDAPDASTTSAAAATVIEAGILGGTAGMIFDAYESRRTTSIGRLIKGDSTGDGIVNIIDASAVVGEIQGTITNSGTPDCTQDGTINIIDASCIVGIIIGGGA